MVYLLDFKSLPDVFTNPGMLYIYKLECTANKKVYIGRTSMPSFRAQTHISALIGNRHKNKALQQDFNIYGADSFTFEILEMAEKRSCCLDRDLEGDYMRKYKSYLEEYGYNGNDPRFTRDKEKTDPTSFRSNVKELCKKKGVSVAKLERDCNLANGSVRKWREGPNIFTAKRIADYFGVEMAYLLKD